MFHPLHRLYAEHKMRGWQPNPEAQAAFIKSLARNAVWASAAPSIVGSGKGKTVLLFENYAKIVDPTLEPHLQEIGDCTSHGWGMAIDILAATEIVAGETEKFVAPIATELLYGCERVQVGGGRLKDEDGGLGAWCAKAVTKYGTLNRLQYLDNKYDFRKYSGTAAKQYGALGVPRDLLPIQSEHHVNTVALITSYVEARDAIANGYPVAVCSGIGFQSVRDADGFAKQEGEWGHCMCFVAVDDAFQRPGLLCWNSWGRSWITGPKRLGQPDGSFWVDKATCDIMLAQADSYAISGYEGFKAQSLDYNLI
jgi:hypothetical protein